MTARPAWSAQSWLGKPEPMFVSALQSLLRASAGLATAGWELSVRITPRGVSWHRLLVGWDTAGLATARILGLPAELSMPEAVASAWQQHASQASQVLLAVEASVPSAERGAQPAIVVDRRAYLQRRTDDPNDTLVLRGYKWRDDDPLNWRQTDYHRVSLNGAQALDALRHAAHEEQRPVALGQAYHAAAEVLSRVSTDLGQRGLDIASMPFELLVATETAAGVATPRSSLCCRLYELDADARVAMAPVHTLLQSWDLAHQGVVLRNVLTHRPLGWLAVGQDRHGDPFLTLYAQASVHDAWQWIASGAGP